MKTSGIIGRIVLTNQMHRGMVEYVLLFATGILGLVFSWPKIPFSPLSNILGGVILIAGLLFHLSAEKNHKQSHSKASDITHIISGGMFSRIRHPLYLSIIVMNIGIALAFGVIPTLIIACLSIVHWIITAVAEESYLLSEFGDEYRKYLEFVHWRFIPGIF